MLANGRAWMLVAVAAVLVGAGCDAANEYPDDLGDDVAMQVGKADYYPVPFLTYRAPEASVGHFTLLAVTDNGIFHRETAVECVTTPCDPQVEEGLPIMSRSGSTNYIRFEDYDGNLIDRYAWKLDGDTLKLRKVNTTKWQSLTKADDAWCNDKGDCDAQELTPACVGTWSCRQAVCVRLCDYQACGEAGGVCGAASACTDGVAGDAQLYPCQHGNVCCLPKSSQPAFDPVAADNVAAAYAAAQTEAEKTLADPSISLVTLSASPVGIGASYAATTYQWKYLFAASAASGGQPKAISVTYPGWATKATSGLPMGSYLAEDDFTAKVKLGFGTILSKAAAAGVTLESCPLTGSGSENPGFIDLRGTFGPGGVVWFWELGCAAMGGIHSFDAATGAERG
jgi:hypothetical protein